jgi:hypothetical protein
MTSKQKGNGNTGSGAISGQTVFGKAGNEPMKLTKLSLTFLTFTASVLLISGLLLRGAAQTPPSDHNASARDDSTQVKIARAMSAGPTEVAKAARIVDADAQGKMVVLREGNNGFTCMPGNLKVVGDPPCALMPLRCSGLLMPGLTNRNRPTRFPASPTCWPALLSAAIQIPMTRPACPSTWVPTG